MAGALGPRDIAQHLADGADLEQRLLPGLVVLGIALQDHADRPLGLDRMLDRGDGARPPDLERQNGAGEEHGIAHRQQGDQPLGQAQLRLRRGLRPRGLGGDLAARRGVAQLGRGLAGRRDLSF